MMASSNNTNAFDFTKSTFCLITGASRGIGQQIAIEFTKKLQNNASTLVLISKSMLKLNETKVKLEQINNKIDIITESIDLSQPSNQQLQAMFDKVLKYNYENAIIIHNAGTIGRIDKKAVELNDLNDWQQYFTLNFFSAAILNSIFVQRLDKLKPKVFIVNITSLAGRQGIPSFSQYGSAKAARDMFFKTMVTEDKHFIVLNYSPGPVKTDMADNILNNTGDNGTRTLFEQMLNDNSFLTTEMTIKKFINILEGGRYETGAIIDYFDIE